MNVMFFLHRAPIFFSMFAAPPLKMHSRPTRQKRTCYSDVDIYVHCIIARAPQYSIEKDDLFVDLFVVVFFFQPMSGKKITRQEKICFN